MEAYRDTTGLHQRQSKYILDLSHTAGMIGAYPYSALCTNGSKLSAFKDSFLTESDVTIYQQLVDTLQKILCNSTTIYNITL